MILLNGQEVTYGVFPNGEMYITKSKLSLKKYNIIKFIYNDQIDIIKLILLKSHLNDHNHISMLYIQYLPYSRMDRTNPDYSVSLKAISRVINFLEFDKVVIREPHSKVSLEWIYNSVEDEWCMAHLKQVILNSSASSLFFPDKGAANRYANDELPIAFGKKTRDFNTGKITSFEISGSIGENVLIIDDICSRGGTFIQAAKKLCEEGAKKISLLVSYCEENVHTGDLFDYIDKLYTSVDCSVTNHPQIIKLGE